MRRDSHEQFLASKAKAAMEDVQKSPNQSQESLLRNGERDNLGEEKVPYKGGVSENSPETRQLCPLANLPPRDSEETIARNKKVRYRYDNRTGYFRRVSSCL